MAKEGISIGLKKPVSAWNKPLKGDFKGLFKSLSKCALHIGTGNWEEVAGDAADALSAVGFEKDPGQVAWLLIRRALTYAIYNLVAESTELMGAEPAGDPNKFCETLDLSLEEADLAIDKRFFEQPSDLAVIEQLCKPFAQWLEGYGLSETDARGVVSRLPSYFVYALHREWGKYPKRYSVVKDGFTSPFIKASEKEQNWRCYAAWLEKQTKQNIFGETFSLSEVYVPLRGVYESRISDADSADSSDKIGKYPGREQEVIKVVVDLESELDGWLKAGNKDDAVRVVTGGPGSGKSCLAKMYAAKHTRDRGLRVLFIPLHLFDVTGDLGGSVRDFVRSAGILSHNPLDVEKGDKRVLLIFDGLDELSMQGKIGAETATEFLDEVERAVNRLNMTGLRVQVVITGRELIVQAHETRFRKPGEVLYVVPYYVSGDEIERGNYKDKDGLLKEDQRDIWWKSYGGMKGEEHEGMPDVLKREDLDEVTAQPLLNYLVALSLSRGKLDFSGAINLNSIYKDLLDAVYARGYETECHKAVRRLTPEQFVRVLEEVSVAAWHGEERSTTIGEIQNHCEKSGVTGLLKLFEAGAEEGVAAFLVSFYFRRCGYREGGDKAFEFTHKSFREYLTGRRILRAIRFMASEFRRRTECPESIWNDQEALKYWVELCGPTAMDSYLFRFVCREVSMENAETAGEWQNMLGRLIEYMLRYGMPIERVEARPRYREETYQARNAEEALLAAASACARVTKTVTKINWPENTSAGAWLAKLQGQRQGPDNPLAFECLPYLSLTGCKLYMRDLYRVNLYKANLERILATFVCLYGTNLEGANLKQAFLHGANLEGANLERANLKGANLEGAKLKGAKLKGAKLGGAKLEGAELKGATGIRGKRKPRTK